MEHLVITSVGAPWGPIRIAATERGLVALDQLVTQDAFEGRLQRRFRTIPVELEAAEAAEGTEATGRAAGHVRQVRDALEVYLGGNLAALRTLSIDLGDRPAWDRQVLEAVRGIPSGSTASYGEIARRIGKAGAARAVGGAVGRNPVGLVIPCHRVIAGDGTIGGYGGAWWGGRRAGLELKQVLLAREGVSIELSAR